MCFYFPLYEYYSKLNSQTLSNNKACKQQHVLSHAYNVDYVLFDILNLVKQHPIGLACNIYRIVRLPRSEIDAGIFTTFAVSSQSRDTYHKSTSHNINCAPQSRSI